MLRNRIVVALAVLVACASAFALTARQEMPQPTETHKELVKGAGEWVGSITIFTPGAPEQKSAARETVVAIGEFWIQAHFVTEFMGMPYVGTGCVGYDERAKKYVGTWIDSMSSYLAVMEGEMDEQSGKLVMRWTAPDMTGQMTQHRHETVHGKDSYTSTFYAGEDSTEPTMKIEMKRKPKADAAK
jgi:hypothetical protein